MNSTDQILKTIETLDSLAEEIKELAIEAARAEAQYKSAYAQHRLRIRATLHGALKTTEPHLADMTEAATTEERLASTIAAAKLQAAREALRAAQSRLEGFRTLAVGERAAGA